MRLNEVNSFIDIETVLKKIEEVAEQHGATVLKVGASNISDAIYIHITKPKEIDAADGDVMETWDALIRVSNHFNDTMTVDRMVADYYDNISDARDIQSSLNSLASFLDGCSATEV